MPEIGPSGLKRAEAARSLPLRYSTSRLICTGQNKPGRSVSELELMEVEQQPNRHVEQFHVTEQLCLVNWRHLLDRLELNEKTIIDQQIEFQLLLEYRALVFDNDFFLIVFCGGFTATWCGEANKLRRYEPIGR